MVVSLIHDTQIRDHVADCRDATPLDDHMKSDTETPLHVGKLQGHIEISKAPVFTPSIAFNSIL